MVRIGTGVYVRRHEPRLVRGHRRGYILDGGGDAAEAEARRVEVVVARIGRRVALAMATRALFYWSREGRAEVRHGRREFVQAPASDGSACVRWVSRLGGA
mgnify:CR=1 FL=1